MTAKIPARQKNFRRSFSGRFRSIPISPKRALKRSFRSFYKKVITVTHPLFAWLMGNDEEASRAYDFIAQRPFWRTRWFLIVLVAVCIVLLWLFFFLGG